mmetsp:Transcript_19849/g.42591  ORF Transcript_19849/g.42591 Transcript_19849/m.42591 type:complete len:802 (-) Transcript_19849:65-2470(-)
MAAQENIVDVNFACASAASTGTSRSRQSRHRSRNLSAHSGGSFCGSTDFFMHDVDISRNHGHGTVPVPGRESHTADLAEFDRYVKIMSEADRLEQDLQWDDDEEESSVEEESGGEESEDHEGANRTAAAAAAAPYVPKHRSQPQDVPIGMNIDMNGDAEGAEKGMGETKISNEHGEFGGSIGLDERPSMLNDTSERKQDDANQTRRLSQASEITQKSVLSQKTQYPFNSAFWTYVRSILSNAKPVGFGELPNPNATALKSPDDASKFLSKVIAIGPLNPIQPAVIAKEGGFDEDEVLAELFYGTLVGLVAMRFSPECIQCGSAVMDTDMLGRVPGKALCAGCNAPNKIESMDKIKVMFLLNSDVLYILAENYACTPSAESMSVTSVFAAVPANSTGSGYSYFVGTGEGSQIAPALEPGRYRMHCPVAKTDNYLVIKRKASDKDKAVHLHMKISDLVYSHKKGKKKAELEAPHGKIRFDIFPDTRSFFVLWVQKNTDDKTLMHLPEDERSPYTSAAKVIHHPIFNALFQDNQVVSVQKNIFLSVSNVVLVFTDIVDSTKLYASLGDGPAFKLVRKHFQVLFGAFTRNGGRVVKTIGDAVMASFTTGKAALSAVSEAMILMPTIGRRPDNNNYVEIRVGIHSGQATVVPLNGVNDYFGQTANIAARVQSAAKASECFVTEAVLATQDARDAYKEITGPGASFKLTPLTELMLKGVDGKVHARGFRWLLRSRRASDISTSGTSFASNYMERRVNRTYSLRMSAQSIDSVGEDDADTRDALLKSSPVSHRGDRRGSTLGAHIEEG